MLEGATAYWQNELDKVESTDLLKPGGEYVGSWTKEDIQTYKKAYGLDESKVSPVGETAHHGADMAQYAMQKWIKESKEMVNKYQQDEAHVWVDEAGTIDAAAYGALKDKEYRKLKPARRGDGVQLGSLLNMVSDAAGYYSDPLPKELKQVIFRYGKAIRALTEMELKDGATTRFKCPNPEGEITEAVILWPSLNDEYIYLPKNYPL